MRTPEHPCTTRCWRVGQPASLNGDGTCNECGRPWPTVDSVIGDDAAPARYNDNADGVETIDRIRSTLGDRGFVDFCLGNEMKYRDRAGKKGDRLTDLKKADWYRDMASHVANGTPDPRVYRKGSRK